MQGRINAAFAEGEMLPGFRLDGADDFIAVTHLAASDNQQSSSNSGTPFRKSGFVFFMLCVVYIKL